MNTLYRTLYLALFLASTPFPATTAASSRYEVAYEDNDNEEIIDKEASTPKKKAKSKKRTKDNWSKRAQQIGLAVVVGGVLIFAYQYHQGKKNDDGGGNNNNNDDEKKDDNKNNENKNDEKKDENKNNNENKNDDNNLTTPIQKYQQCLKNLQNDTEENKTKSTQFSGDLLLHAKDGNNKTFLQLLKEHTQANNWEQNIGTKNQALVDAIATICTTNKWNITSDKGDAHGNFPAIANFIHSMIDDTDPSDTQKPTEKQAAYALAQILHCITDATDNKNTMQKLVNQKENYFLAKLVDVYQDKGMGLPSMNVLCQVGGANPKAQPSFGSSESYPFFNNTGNDAKTIQTIARRKKGDNNRLAFKQQNNKPWTVEPLGNDADNDNSKQP